MINQRKLITLWVVALLVGFIGVRLLTVGG